MGVDVTKLAAATVRPVGVKRAVRWREIDALAAVEKLNSGDGKSTQPWHECDPQIALVSRAPQRERHRDDGVARCIGGRQPCFCVVHAAIKRASAVRHEDFKLRFFVAFLKRMHESDAVVRECGVTRRWHVGGLPVARWLAATTF